MTKQEIIRALKKLYPEADKIVQDLVYKNLWNVYIVDDYEETSIAYAVREGQLRLVGEIVCEL